MGKIGYRNPDVTMGKEDEAFLTELAHNLNCSTVAQLQRWIVRYVLDEVPASEFGEYVRRQSDLADKAKYDFDDIKLQNRTAA